MIRLGFIKYSNCFPIYYPFRNNIFDITNTEIIEDIPSGLNALCRKGNLDISSVSSVEYPSLQDEYVVIDNLSLNSFGYVNSVNLISKYKIEDLDGKKIGLTSASSTSHCLLKIILKDHYKINPKYIIFSEPDSSFDAFLIIGDRALMNINKYRKKYIYDIGKMWADIYKLPVIFALWVAKKATLDKNYETMKKLIFLLQQSRSITEKHWQEFIKLAADRYRDIKIDFENYYSNLRYNFDKKEISAYLFFIKKAYELGLSPEIKKLTMVSDYE